MRGRCPVLTITGTLLLRSEKKDESLLTVFGEVSILLRYKLWVEIL